MRKIILGTVFFAIGASGFMLIQRKETKAHRGGVESKIEKGLPSSFLVSYGDPKAPIQITEYFSFFCPYCLKIFREDFLSIKEKYLDTGHIYWTFHPVPMDLITIQGMDCLEKLPEPLKRAFLQVFLEEAEYGDPNFCTAILKRAMDVLETPIPELDSKDYLENTNAFKEAFQFIQKGEIVEAVPSIEINGTLIKGEVPTLKFINQIIQGGV